MALSDEAIEKRMADLRDTAGKYAKAYALTEHLGEFKKSKLAILMKKAERNGHTTAAAQEREARADQEYLTLLDSLQVATEDSERLRWELKLAEIGVDVWRTQESSKRAEKRGYGA